MVKMAYADLFMAQKSIEILREQLEILRTLFVRQKRVIK